MLTLQRSPRILCADVLDQVNFQKDPTLANLCPRYLSGTGFLLQRDRMNQEIGGGFLQGERLHGITSKNTPSLRACRRQSRQNQQCQRR